MKIPTEIFLQILSYTDLVDQVKHDYDSPVRVYSCRKYNLRLLRRHDLRRDISVLFAISRYTNVLAREVFFKNNRFQFSYEISQYDFKSNQLQFDHDIRYYYYEGLGQCSASDLKNLRYLHIELAGMWRLRHVLDWVVFLHHLHQVTNPAMLHLKLFVCEDYLDWDQDVWNQEVECKFRGSAERIGSAEGIERLVTSETAQHFLCEEVWLPKFGKLELAWPIALRGWWETILCIEQGAEQDVDLDDHHEWLMQDHDCSSLDDMVNQIVHYQDIRSAIGKIPHEETSPW